MKTIRWVYQSNRLIRKEITDYSLKSFAMKIDFMIGFGYVTVYEDNHIIVKRLQILILSLTTTYDKVIEIINISA